MSINAINELNTTVGLGQRDTRSATTTQEAAAASKATTQVETKALGKNEAADGFAKGVPGSTEAGKTYSPKTQQKKLSAEQVRALTEQQTAAYQSMITSMLNQQVYQTKNKEGTRLSDIILGINTPGSKLTNLGDQLASFEIGAADAKSAADSIGKDGYWGVDAVATRIMDMAVALSGGDNSKLEVLQKAVEKGFSSAQKSWGTQKMPSITQSTQEEVSKRFDYWKENGSLDGYKEKATEVDKTEK